MVLREKLEKLQDKHDEYHYNSHAFTIALFVLLHFYRDNSNFNLLFYNDFRGYHLIKYNPRKLGKPRPCHRRFSTPQRNTAAYADD